MGGVEFMPFVKHVRFNHTNVFMCGIFVLTQKPEMKVNSRAAEKKSVRAFSTLSRSSIRPAAFPLKFVCAPS
jgi:hypothetical protein